MKPKIFFAIIFLLLKTNRAMNVAKQNKCSKTKPSNPANFDHISIPSGFMNDLNEHNMRDLLASPNDSLDVANTCENITTKELISSIKIFIDEHLSPKEVKLSDDIHQAKFIIDAIIDKLSDIDFTGINTTASNICENNLKISLISIMNKLKFSLELKNFENLANMNKKRRLILLSDLLLEFKSCFESFFKFYDKYHEIRDILRRIEEFSSRAVTSSDHSNQPKKSPRKRKKSLEGADSLSPSKSPKNYIPSNNSLNHVFTCDIPPEGNNWMVKSFCKSNTGVWYFAITHRDIKHFYILKINQMNFDNINSNYEIIKEYSTVSKNETSLVGFHTFCRKIIVNPSGTLYVLKYSKTYISFEILALDSNFHLIKKLEKSSFSNYGLLDSFIEDIEIHSELLYMLDSKNRRIIVTDFDFNVRHIIKVKIEFEKFRDGSEVNFKTRMSLIVTNESFYIYFNCKMYTCKNNTKIAKSAGIKMVEEVLKITIQDPSSFSSFEQIVYIGKDSFISFPFYYKHFLTFSQLVTNATTLKLDSTVRPIDNEAQIKRKSFAIAVMEDYSVYVVEGGSNIKIYKLDVKNVSKII